MNILNASKVHCLKNPFFELEVSRREAIAKIPTYQALSGPPIERFSLNSSGLSSEFGLSTNLGNIQP